MDNESVMKKSKRFAWIIAIILPVLYMGLFLRQFGGMGDIVALIFYIPLFFIAVMVLHLITAPLLRVMLNKSSRPIARRAGICGLTILITAFLVMTYAVNILPREEVRAAVKEIPDMIEYFTEHKDELEAQRLADAADTGAYWALYDRRNNDHLLIEFVYFESDSPFVETRTGYRGRYGYVYVIDQNWHIDIGLYLPD